MVCCRHGAICYNIAVLVRFMAAQLHRYGPVDKQLCPYCGRALKRGSSFRSHLSKSKRGMLASCSKKTASYDASATQLDDYDTPLWVWEELFLVCPQLLTQRLWDPFFNKGETRRNWKRLGVKQFTHAPGDFWKRLESTKFMKKQQVIVTNPPFSDKQNIVKALKATGLPFIVLLPMEALFTLWFHEVVGRNYKIVLVTRPIQFNGGPTGKSMKLPCVFVCVGTGPRKSLAVTKWRNHTDI